MGPFIMITIFLIFNFNSDFLRRHPNQIEQPEWQNFFIDEQTEQVIMPYYTLANQHRTYQNYQFNLKQVECEFWKKYYSKF